MRVREATFADWLDAPPGTEIEQRLIWRRNEDGNWDKIHREDHVLVKEERNDN